MTRVVLYARVSTVSHGQDPELQLRELRQYCEHRGWTQTGEYVDLGVSGAKERRPELDRLMADAHRRRFDVVIVWKFDRFARSVSHLLRALETFGALGIDFVSFTEQMDTSTPVGQMIFTVLGALSALERGLIVERVKQAFGTHGLKANTSEDQKLSWTCAGWSRCATAAHPGLRSPRHWELEQVRRFAPIRGFPKA
jgi:DNA invertase Pin-like site-specific DNA recombinase